MTAHRASVSAAVAWPLGQLAGSTWPKPEPVGVALLGEQVLEHLGRDARCRRARRRRRPRAPRAAVRARRRCKPVPPRVRARGSARRAVDLDLASRATTGRARRSRAASQRRARGRPCRRVAARPTPTRPRPHAAAAPDARARRAGPSRALGMAARQPAERVARRPGRERGLCAFRPAFETQKYGVCRPPKPRTKCSMGSTIEPSKSNTRETSEARRIASQ